MKPITEQRRQALIERLKKIASWDETYGPDHNVILPASAAKEMAEAYIASLTAEPRFQIQKISYNNKVWIDVSSDNEAIASKSNGYRYRQLYSAPPVPVIKLPGVADDSSFGGLSLAKAYGWNACLAEIKRLNGLAE